MSPPIKLLPSNVINLIAAGEVIDSVAAVVRELVENALDAGATRLVISLLLENWRIQVADNGSGMGLEDLRNCAKPHSTSKINQLSDLWKINSLGFRGEALHSLVQVAQLEIASRQSDGVGWCVGYQSSGESFREEPTAIAVGTIVKVADLFGKMPVRRQGLPSLSTQLKAVQNLIENMSLCHPQVTWQVWHNNRSLLNISPGKTAQYIIPQLLKRVHHHDLCFLSQTVNIPQDLLLSSSSKEGLIEVTLGLPDRCHRHRPDWVKVGVNGRIVRSPRLEQTILTSFSRTLPKDRFPVCFLHLTVSPNQIDWNRHPAKTEIYLHCLDFWQEQVAKIIEQGLRLSPQNFTTATQNQRVGKLLKVSEEKTTYNVYSQGKNNANTEIGLIALKALAQVRNTYIVAEHSSGLWLIEQHIAHERVLYEKLLDDWQLVNLDRPIILAQLSENQVEQLQRIGLEIEIFGEYIWAVRTIPKMLATRDDCQDALVELSLGGDLQTAQVATACRSAIRNGTPLNLSEMQELLDSWKNTRNPATCPHGRPIYLALEESSLARFFRRNWVIGKSHGI
ncbi:MAG TPA: DNA mismatch repair endonuclease MutL [Cyanothece sp. UBA12306]|nr:DNA mismatch repair endonuclease MutL [Cyanothece sp. UBA12306]